MIGAIKGTVLHKRIDGVIVMVGGVGYVVFIPQGFLSQLLINQELLIYTYTHVREDTLQLFGFKTQEDLQLFELLLTVSGIGPKTALAIIDRGVENIKQAVSGADVAFFTSIPRLGTKNAQKVIIELKSKLGSIKDLDLIGVSGETQDLIEALTSVGFSKLEAGKVLPKLPTSAKTLEEKVRFSLKYLGKKL